MDPETNIVREPDPVKHSQIRNMFAQSFSPKSLLEQEPIVQQYVDLFIEQIGKHGTGKEGLEIVRWFNYCTFDVRVLLTFSSTTLFNGG